ncbi:MAG: PQQ-binding-like beta-propeller repeat protein [Verrucomicrobia bacterium]|nr:PQQ-binding-like beta-propeller repeat protein [Verrucomicrobiota bacterium]
MRNLFLRFTLAPVCIGFALTITSVRSAQANWPTWRGPNANGISSETNLPLRWSPTENVLWRAPLPEPGNSTPVVWGKHIFVTQPIAEGNRRTLLCVDRDTGRVLWQSGIQVATEERTHDTNPFASGSPVTDGERVICWFGSGGLAAYDFAGRELWRTDLGRHDHRFGYGGSPVIHGDHVFLNFGPGAREFVVAVNKETGKEVWRHESPTAGKDDIYGTWSTPFVAEWEGGAQLISALRGELAGLDPESGKVLWKTASLGTQAKSSPVAGEGVVVMSGDMESSELAVRLGGRGDVTDTHVLWKRNPAKRRVGTGIILNGHIFSVQTSGIADCVKLETGEVVWDERLRGSGANNAVWSSPVLAGDRIYVMNQAGDVIVYRASTNFEVLAVNPMNEPSNSSVVVSDGRILLRTHKALWCVGEK